MIGFFDSGIGGLTVLEPVRKILGQYNYLYLGDSARAPYGEKSHDELVQFVEQGADFLFKQGCELIILACNSASANALSEVQRNWLAENYPEKRILGVIRPTVEELVDDSYKDILILGTTATISSGAYNKEFKKLNDKINVIGLDCPKWGFMIESGLAGTNKMKIQIDEDLSKLNIDKIDAVLLACTHYPYVKLDIEQNLFNKYGDRIPVFEQGDLVAKSLKNYLINHPKIEESLQKGNRVRYLTTGNAKKSSQLAKTSFGYEVEFENINKLY